MRRHTHTHTQAYTWSFVYNEQHIFHHPMFLFPNNENGNNKLIWYRYGWQNEKKKKKIERLKENLSGKTSKLTLHIHTQHTVSCTYLYIQYIYIRGLQCIHLSFWNFVSHFWLNQLINYYVKIHTNKINGFLII